MVLAGEVDDAKRRRRQPDGNQPAANDAQHDPFEMIGIALSLDRAEVNDQDAVGHELEQAHL
jgi:hypothetical protein